MWRLLLSYPYYIPSSVVGTRELDFLTENYTTDYLNYLQERVRLSPLQLEGNKFFEVLEVKNLNASNDPTEK